MTAQDAFIDGLHNADAMEKQALSIMQPPLNRLEHYPEVSALLDRRIRETEDQITRLDDVLDSVGASASVVNDVGLSFAGTMASVGHLVASDEILPGCPGRLSMSICWSAFRTGCWCARNGCGGT